MPKEYYLSFGNFSKCAAQIGGGGSCSKATKRIIIIRKVDFWSRTEGTTKRIAAIARTESAGQKSLKEWKEQQGRRGKSSCLISHQFMKRCLEGAWTGTGIVGNSATAVSEHCWTPKVAADFPRTDLFNGSHRITVGTDHSSNNAQNAAHKPAISFTTASANYSFPINTIFNNNASKPASRKHCCFSNNNNNGRDIVFHSSTSNKHSTNGILRQHFRAVAAPIGSRTARPAAAQW